jgi:hypothetical protein
MNSLEDNQLFGFSLSVTALDKLHLLGHFCRRGFRCQIQVNLRYPSEPLATLSVDFSGHCVGRLCGDLWLMEFSVQPRRLR